MWPALILAVLGNAMQQKQTKEAARRRTRELRAGREKGKGVEAKQREDVLKESSKFDPTLRQEAMETSATETEKQIMDVLSENEMSTTGDVGVISDKLLAQRGKSMREKANRASILAALMSKVQAPGDVATEEGLSLQDLTSRSRGRTGEMRRIGSTSDLLANLEGMTDPKAMAVGGLMQQLGLSAASGSIMEGLTAPGAGLPQATPVPGYAAPDAFNVRGIR